MLVIFFFFFFKSCYGLGHFFLLLLHSHPGPNIPRASVGSRQEREPGEQAGSLPAPAGEGQGWASIRAGPAFTPSLAKPCPPARRNRAGLGQGRLQELLAHGSRAGLGVTGEPWIKCPAACFELATCPKRNGGRRNHPAALQPFHGKETWWGQGVHLPALPAPSWRVVVR